MSELTHDSQAASEPQVRSSALLCGVVELSDGWKLDNTLDNNCSRIIRPDGVTAVYRYQKTSVDEAVLLKWGYQEGGKAATREKAEKIKAILGL